MSPAEQSRNAELPGQRLKNTLQAAKKAKVKKSNTPTTETAYTAARTGWL